MSVDNRDVSMLESITLLIFREFVTQYTEKFLAI